MCLLCPLEKYLEKYATVYIRLGLPLQGETGSPVLWAYQLVDSWLVTQVSPAFIHWTYCMTHDLWFWHGSKPPTWVHVWAADKGQSTQKNYILVQILIINNSRHVSTWCIYISWNFGNFLHFFPTFLAMFQAPYMRYCFQWQQQTTLSV